MSHSKPISLYKTSKLVLPIKTKHTKSNDTKKSQNFLKLENIASEKMTPILEEKIDFPDTESEDDITPYNDGKFEEEIEDDENIMVYNMNLLDELQNLVFKINEDESITNIERIQLRRLVQREIRHTSNYYKHNINSLIITSKNNTLCNKRTKDPYEQALKEWNKLKIDDKSYFTDDLVQLQKKQNKNNQNESGIKNICITIKNKEFKYNKDNIKGYPGNNNNKNNKDKYIIFDLVNTDNNENNKIDEFNEKYNTIVDNNNKLCIIDCNNMSQNNYKLLSESVTTEVKMNDLVAKSKQFKKRNKKKRKRKKKSYSFSHSHSYSINELSIRYSNKNNSILCNVTDSDNESNSTSSDDTSDSDDSSDSSIDSISTNFSSFMASVSANETFIDGEVSTKPRFSKSLELLNMYSNELIPLNENDSNTEYETDIENEIDENDNTNQNNNDTKGFRFLSTDYFENSYEQRKQSMSLTMSATELLIAECLEDL